MNHICISSLGADKLCFFIPMLNSPTLNKIAVIGNETKRIYEFEKNLNEIRTQVSSYLMTESKLASLLDNHGLNKSCQLFLNLTKKINTGFYSFLYINSNKPYVIRFKSRKVEC